MIRILVFILGAVFVAGLITFLASMNTQVEAEAFDTKFSIHTGVFIGLMLIIPALIIYFTNIYKDVKSLPQRMKARQTEARLNKGLEALTRGFEAIAMGEAVAAQQHARLAQKHLTDPSLTRLLTAQAAQMSGDEKTAEKSFAAMLEAPETEFLGLRGLYLQAMAKGDKQAAHGYAERAFALRSDAVWAFESVVELGLERGAWGETRDIVATAKKNAVIDADKARRAEAALLTADAYAANTSGDNALALEEAEAALKLAPGFAPAAALAARLHAQEGRKPKAAKILEAAFAEAPHPAIAVDHDDLYKDETAEHRAAQMRRLADRRPDSREARLVDARRLTLLGRFEDAMTVLEPLLLESAGSREYALMAEAVAGARGQAGEAQARAFLKRAAAAPRDPTPGADGNFHFSREGWARLVREYMDFERLAPPPLDAAPKGVTQEELRVIAPPPSEPEPAPEQVPSPPALDAKSAEAIEKEAEERARAIAAAGQVS